MNAIVANRELASQAFFEKREVLENLPDVVALYAGHTCNLRCLMCRGHSPFLPSSSDRKPALFDLGLLPNAAALIATAEFCEFHGQCEPMLTERFWELADYAQKISAVPDMRRVCILTNGNYPLTTERIDRMLGPGIARVTFSVDA
jgi:MoaA/NifB/PqqE/SkfB family radical SAM enzyme